MDATLQMAGLHRVWWISASHNARNWVSP
jgi:hypothetical protein